MAALCHYIFYYVLVTNDSRASAELKAVNNCFIQQNGGGSRDLLDLDESLCNGRKKLQKAVTVLYVSFEKLTTLE